MKTCAPPRVMNPTWHHLLFLHWPVEPSEIQASLPRGLEVDTFEGNAWIGVVAFAMQHVRPHFLPSLGSCAPLVENFLELNVRTYVRCEGKPGVWFYSLDAANPAAVVAARAWFSLPYYKARMRLRRNPDGGFHFSSRRLWPRPLPASLRVRYQVQGPVSEALPGTLEHFLVERYSLFSRRGGRMQEGVVAHSPYPLQVAQISLLQENVVAAAGLARPHAAPHALYSRGVNVTVFGLQHVTRDDFSKGSWRM